MILFRKAIVSNCWIRQSEWSVFFVNVEWICESFMPLGMQNWSDYDGQGSDVKIGVEELFYKRTNVEHG
jgi:hypothetical protein